MVGAMLLAGCADHTGWAEQYAGEFRVTLYTWESDSCTPPTPDPDTWERRLTQVMIVEASPDGAVVTLEGACRGPLVFAPGDDGEPALAQWGCSTAAATLAPGGLLSVRRDVYDAGECVASILYETRVTP